MSQYLETICPMMIASLKSTEGIVVCEDFTSQCIQNGHTHTITILQQMQIVCVTILYTLELNFK